MSDKSILERVAGTVALVSIAVAVTGTKACQEDYEVGAQASFTKSPTTTTTPSVTVTGTVTISATDTPGAGGSATPTPTEDVESADGGDGSEGNDTGLLEELSALSDEGGDDLPIGGGSAGSSAKGNGNWLGKGFDGSQWEDDDGDGFSNARESSSQSDAADANSTPTDVARGQLDERLRQLDQDMDGLLNDEEAKRGTNPNLSDSDGDGKTDGAEVLSGSNPLDPNSLYDDVDGDGLSNSYEESKGFNPNSNDSDNDGLRDDLEIVVGSNPMKVDSDGDGISDGREYDLNSDPLLGEPDRIG